MTPSRSGDRVLIVMTSHAQLGDTGRPTGAYLPEVAHAWKVFADAGYTVDLMSVLGGAPPLEGVNPRDPIQEAFLNDAEMRAKLASAARPDEVEPDHYEVVFFAGGHGSAWDFPDEHRLAALTRAIYEAGGVVAAVCHGPAALVNVVLSDGTYLVDGRRVSSFTNDEERAVGMTDVVPFLLADKLTERGAVHVAAPSFIPHVEIDGRLVTGQNPPSAGLVAQGALRCRLQPEARPDTGPPVARAVVG